MHSRSMQLHIMPEEVAELIEKIFDQHACRLGIVRQIPFMVKELCRRDIWSEVVNGNESGFVLFFRQEIITAESVTGFFIENKDIMQIRLERPIGMLLHDSLFGSACESSEIDSMCQKILRSVRAKANRGLYATSQRLGNSWYEKSCLYTNGAAEFEKSGEGLVDVTGSVRFSLNEFPAFSS